MRGVRWYLHLRFARDVPGKAPSSRVRQTDARSQQTHWMSVSPSPWLRSRPFITKRKRAAFHRKGNGLESATLAIPICDLWTPSTSSHRRRNSRENQERPGLIARPGRLSERTLGGSSPPATCGAHITKELAENEPRTFWNQSGYTSPPQSAEAPQPDYHDHPSTRPMNAASTASSGATFPSSAVRQLSRASIRCNVDSAVDFRASTTI